MKRIVVIGTSCTGKTTFSSKLASSLNIEHIELDSIYWKENWQPTDDEIFVPKVKKRIDKDEWLVEGNYKVVRDLVWSKATDIIWLNFPFHIVFFRCLSRTIKRIISKEKVYADNVETFRKAFFSKDSIILWTVQTYKMRKRVYGNAFREKKYTNLTYHKVNNPKQAKKLIYKI